MFDKIALQLGLNTTWTADVTTWGERVLLYRQYAEGNHRSNLTDNMRSMLQVKGSADTEYNINYCNTIIQTMIDRLVVAQIDTDSKPATAWVSNVLLWNSFDVLQMDVHEAAVRDGDAYVMVGYKDSDKDKYPTLSVELAWDGTVGVVPIYDPANATIIAAVKVYWDTREVDDGKGNKSNQAMRRCNLYLPDKILRYWYDGGEFIKEDKWEAGYVPLVHFRNNTRTNTWQGISEIAPAIGLQDSLNSVLKDMTMASTLSAFGIYVAIGFKAPTQVSPGMWLQVGNEDNEGRVIPIPRDQLADVKQLSASPLAQYIEQSHYLIDQMATITRTPLSRMGSDNRSGESLKQSEVGLLAKVKKAQTRFAESWGWAIELAQKVSLAYAKLNPAPSDDILVAVKWQNSEIRNDAESIKNALMVRDDITPEAFLRLVAPVFGWDEATIQKEALAKKNEKESLLAGVNGYGVGGAVDGSP